MKLTVSEAAGTLDQSADGWLNDSRTTESITSAVIRASKKLSKDPIFNLAAYMRWNYGGCLRGETDADWLENAKNIRKFFKK